MKNGNLDLFGEPNTPPALPEGVFYTREVASLPIQADLVAAVEAIARSAPFQHPRTPGGKQTSAAMTNAGDAGWWSDKAGYRYITHQPEKTAPWPKFPHIFNEIVTMALSGKPWPDFTPDACLINFYGLDAKMGLHQDRDERDMSQPIVTISLGDDADFLIGGFARGDKTQTLRLSSGDALVMGGASRMRFHGIRKIYPGTSPLEGVKGRYSLTFRKAL